MVQPSAAEEIREKVVLSTLVAKHVKLTKTGKEWRGLCPFHKEETPSFYVNDEKGFFHCFGCSAHGDAIDWLIRHGMTRQEAIADLAKRTGVTMRKGGGKLNRSETVTVRLDPKLNYLCELASRAQRRTKSSFIEWAVAEALGTVTLSDLAEGETSENTTIKNVAGQLWHVDEADRLVALATRAPALLTHDEQLIWRLIRENGFIWRGRYDARNEWCWDIHEGGIIRDRLREKWDLFKSVAAGEESEAALPKWVKTLVDNNDDDLPF